VIVAAHLRQTVFFALGQVHHGVQAVSKGFISRIGSTRWICYSPIRVINEGDTMKNPLESLHMTVVLGVVLTVIMVLVAQNIAV
jgi:hypothetical protein